MKPKQNEPIQINSKQNASRQAKHNKTARIKTKQTKQTSIHVKPSQFKTQQHSTHQIKPDRSNQIERNRQHKKKHPSQIKTICTDSIQNAKTSQSNINKNTTTRVKPMQSKTRKKTTQINSTLNGQIASNETNTTQTHSIKPKQPASTHTKHNKTTQIKAKQVNNTTSHAKPIQFNTQQNNTNQSNQNGQITSNEIKTTQTK